MTFRANRGRLVVAFTVTGVFVAFAIAQRQVNTMVNNRASQPIYPPGTGGSVRYSNAALSSRTSQMMNSELRYEYRKAGATQSDVRMGYAALGPRAEGGAMRYIDHKPAYLEKKDAPAPPPSGQAKAKSMGSVRYASSNASPSLMPNQARDTRVSPKATNSTAGSSAAKSTAVASGPVSTPLTAPYGTVRYTR